MEKICVSSEEYRDYHYGDGSSFRVAEPVDLFLVSDGGRDSHRIVASDGVTYRPERGWVAISWKPKSGHQPFVK